MAGQNVSINIRPNIVFTQQPSSGAGSNVALTIPEQILCILSNGVLADQIDLLYPGSSTAFTGTTPQTIDFTSGLVDIFGNAINFARLSGYLITNRSTTDGVTLIVTPGASNGNVSILEASSGLIVPASTATNTALVMGTAPNTTGFFVDGTHKTLTFTPSATLTSDIWFWGRHS